MERNCTYIWEGCLLVASFLVVIAAIYCSFEREAREYEFLVRKNITRTEIYTTNVFCLEHTYIYIYKLLKRRRNSSSISPNRAEIERATAKTMRKHWLLFFVLVIILRIFAQKQKKKKQHINLLCLSCSLCASLPWYLAQMQF